MSDILDKMEKEYPEENSPSGDKTRGSDVTEKELGQIKQILNEQEEKENLDEIESKTTEQLIMTNDTQSSDSTETSDTEKKRERSKLAKAACSPEVNDMRYYSWVDVRRVIEGKERVDTRSRSKASRLTSGHRKRYQDVTNQLNFSVRAASSWAGQQQQQQQRVAPTTVAGQRYHRTFLYSPQTDGYSHQNNSSLSSRTYSLNFNYANNNCNYINCDNNLSNNNSSFLQNSKMGSAGISSAILGHTPSPYRSNAHVNAYAGQNFSRPQLPGNFQQPMCNGYGSPNNNGAQSRNGPRSSAAGTRRNSTGSPAASLSSTNVYIRGLDQSTTDQDLREMCMKFGRIASTKAIMDKTTGQCKRYGFVDFEEACDAQRAVEGLNQEGKVQAQMAKAMSPNNQNSLFQQQEQDPTNLYLANLPPDFTESDLQKLLQDYGSTISTRVLKNIDGSSRCVGFARMDNGELCTRIIRDMNGKKVIPGCNLPLMVKNADNNKKMRNRPLQSVPELCSSLTHLEITPPCFATSPYDQSGQYIRTNPNYQYLLAPPSPYVYNPHPQYHVFSGYGDAPMGNLAAQMQNLSLQGANAMLQPPTELTNIGPGTSMTASQGPPGTPIPQVAMQTYATVPLYAWPYGVQAADPNMMGGAVVTSTTPLQSFVPDLTATMHADVANAAATAAAVAAAAAATVPTNQVSGQVVYTSQPPPPPPPPPQAPPMPQN